MGLKLAAIAQNADADAPLIETDKLDKLGTFDRALRDKLNPLNEPTDNDAAPAAKLPLLIVPIILPDTPEIDPNDADIDPPDSELNEPDILPATEPNEPPNCADTPDIPLDAKLLIDPPTDDKGDGDLTPYPPGGIWVTTP